MAVAVCCPCPNPSAHEIESESTQGPSVVVCFIYVDAGDFVGGNSSCSTNSHRSRVLELLERNRKAARSDGLYRFVLWREALRGATTDAGGAGSSGCGGEATT